MSSGSRPASPQAAALPVSFGPQREQAQKYRITHLKGQLYVTGNGASNAQFEAEEAPMFQRRIVSTAPAHATRIPSPGAAVSRETRTGTLNSDLPPAN